MSNNITNKLLFCFVWISAFAAVVVITMMCHQNAASFIGITEQREVNISSQMPVEVGRVHVLEGEYVEIGQLLLELKNQELDFRIDRTVDQLKKLKAMMKIDSAETLSKRNELEAKKTQLSGDIKNRIKQLKNQHKIEQSLAKNLKGIDLRAYDEKSGIVDPILLNIERLQQELSLSIKPLNVQIGLLNDLLNEDVKPLEVQISKLDGELLNLKQQKNRLIIHAPLNGVIGSIHFKMGEKASPFSTIMSVHPKRPSYIKGFIDEHVHTRLSIGENVEIVSMADSAHRVGGEVIGLSSRIVECPIRLRKYPDRLTWGRETTIRVPKNNDFILGEKVIVKLDGSESSWFDRVVNHIQPQNLQADNTYFIIKPQKPMGTDFNRTYIPIIPIGFKKIEASGLIYLPDIERYLLISDDTPNKSAMLFLMNEDGLITNEITIEEAGKIDDMEAITSGEDGMVYIASSFNPNKSGDVKEPKKYITAVNRDGLEFRLVKKFDMYTALETCANKNRDDPWAKFIRHAISSKDIDIEGMFYHQRAIYLGFKSPLKDGKSVILKIDDINTVFENNSIRGDQIAIWKTFCLKSIDYPHQEAIADLFYDNQTLYICGVGNTGNIKSGSLWRIRNGSKVPERLKFFRGLKPEGVSRGTCERTLVVCFDQGSKKQSQILEIRNL